VEDRHPVDADAVLEGGDHRPRGLPRLARSVRREHQVHVVGGVGVRCGHHAAAGVRERRDQTRARRGARLRRHQVEAAELARAPRRGGQRVRGGVEEVVLVVEGGHRLAPQAVEAHHLVQVGTALRGRRLAADEPAAPQAVEQAPERAAEPGEGGDRGERRTRPGADPLRQVVADRPRQRAPP
jgi:hypothetical protein